ncbi:hypothetical protein ACWGH3_38610 [Streptomyces sp. NPDC054884]
MGLLDAINPLDEIAVDVLACGPAASARCPPRSSLRTQGRSPFTVIVDRQDDVRITRTVLAAHHPASGRISIHPTVGGGGRLLWHDILHTVADGRPLRAPASTERGSAPVQEHAARSALKAAAVQRMTVLRAHRIGWGVWADLMALHRTTDTDVLMVHHAEIPADLAHLLRHCDHRILTAPAGVQALHPPAAERTRRRSSATASAPTQAHHARPAGAPGA